MSDSKLSLDFIAGLIVGEGTFYWTGSTHKVPAFALKMHVRDRELVTMVRDSLGLKDKVRVHEYIHDNRHFVFLLIRHPRDIKNKLIPLIYPRLRGYKKEQFIYWFHKFSDDDVSENYKFIFNIFKNRFPELYIKNNISENVL